MADIFLSYAHENLEQARVLAELLTGFGWTVFWDREILAGSVFDDVIQQQLDQAKCVICLWSVQSVSSQWVRAEAEEGANRNMLVSVLIEDVRLPIAFRRIQAAKLLNWTGSKDDEQLKDVLRAIKFVVEKPPQERGTGTAEPAVPLAATPTGASGVAAAPARVQTTAPAAPTAGTRSAGVITAILAGAVVLGGAAWFFARSSSGANTTAQPSQIATKPGGSSPQQDSALQPPTGTRGTPASGAVASDQELLGRAREIAEALGHGKIAIAREQFTPELQATAAATQWRQRLRSLGELVQVETPERAGGSGNLREVRVVMKHQNSSVAAVLTFVPNGKVCGFSAPNSNYRGGCK